MNNAKRIKKLKKIVLLFISLLFFSTGFGAIQLSDRAEISLITCAPGNELYAAFGHSAIRVADPVANIDVVYNYGTFDFNAPNFYVKFVRGFLDYMLDKHSYRNFLAAYMYEKRTIEEQILQLTANEKQQIFDFLEWNARPENRTYRYDFFYDNCATRIRDVFEDELGNKLVFDNNYVDGDDTFRELLDIYLESRPWWDASIDLILGKVIDVEATPRQYMFLPDFLNTAFDNARIVSDSSTYSLVKSEITVYEGEDKNAKADVWDTLSPVVVFWGLLVVVVLLSFFTKLKKKIWLFDYILLIFSGLLGLLIFLLWFATEHHTTHQNLNIIWMSPLHLISVFVLLFRKKISWYAVYFLIFAAINLLFLLFSPVLPQSIHAAFIPFILLLTIRFANVKLYAQKH